MSPDLADWIAKAEAVCFHAQQCVEKYLKARLILADIRFPKTHDLVALLALVQKTEPLWQPWKDHLAKLTHYAVTVRYPGESAERADAAEAVKLARLLRIEIRWSLGLSAKPARRGK